MTSYVDLGNESLVKLGHEEFITSLEQNTKAARLINQCYQSAKRVVIRSHTWNFAKKRVILAPSTTVPVFGGRRYFPNPDDWIRTLRDKDNIYDEFDIESGGVRFDGTSFDMIYLANIDDPNKFDELFNQAFSTYVARQICMGLTGDKKLFDTMAAMYKDDLSLARSINGQEQGFQVISSEDFISSRY